MCFLIFNFFQNQIMSYRLANSEDFNIFVEITELKRLTPAFIDPSLKQFYINVKLLNENHQQKTRRMAFRYDSDSEQQDQKDSNLTKGNKSLNFRKQNRVKQGFIDCGMIWNEGFYYSIKQIVNDKFALSLMGLKGEQPLQNYQVFEKQFVAKEKEYLIGEAIVQFSKIRKVAETKYRGYEVQLISDKNVIGILELKISYYEGQTIAGAICAPNLSLVPNSQPNSKKLPLPLYIPQPVFVNDSFPKSDIPKNSCFDCFGDSDMIDLELPPKEFKNKR